MEGIVEGRDPGDGPYVNPRQGRLETEQDKDLRVQLP
jgi:hypothetical protein